jgi:hypothetical protein
VTGVVIGLVVSDVSMLVVVAVREMPLSELIASGGNDDNDDDVRGVEDDGSVELQDSIRPVVDCVCGCRSSKRTVKRTH